MNSNIKISYPGSEKVYMQGSIYPDVRVGMRLVKQMPTVTVNGGERVETPNPSVYIYDTSGPYSDENVSIDLEKGLPRMRESWIKANLSRGRGRRTFRCSSKVQGMCLCIRFRRIWNVR